MNENTINADVTTGGPNGALLYMSSEQLNGDTPKPAQDIYSFAAMDSATRAYLRCRARIAGEEDGEDT